MLLPFVHSYFYALKISGQIVVKQYSNVEICINYSLYAFLLSITYTINIIKKKFCLVVVFADKWSSILTIIEQKEILESAYYKGFQGFNIGTLWGTRTLDLLVRSPNDKYRFYGFKPLLALFCPSGTPIFSIVSMYF